MKITSIEIIRPPDDGRASDGTRWRPTFIRVNTDEGISGFGEIGLAYSDAIDAATGILKDFCPIIIGMDPTKTEQIWNVLLRSTFWGQGGGGVVFGGISAIDMALWDIKGKMLQVPVYQLLGGKTNERLRTYASQVQFDWAPESKNLITPEEYADVTLRAMAEGYDCVKVDPLGVNKDGTWEWNFTGMLTAQQIKMAVDRVAAMRESGGDNLDIIIELHSQTDVNSAIQLGQALEPFRCMYYEEPTQPLNAKIFRSIAQKVNIPLAAGERIYSRWGYRPFLEDRSLSIIQPDLGNTGGITEGKKICDMAALYDVGVQLHLCGGPIAIAAALQLEAVIPNFVIHEHHQYAMIQKNIDLCTYDYQPYNGYYEVPDRPGIGQEVTEDTIRRSEVILIK